MFSVENGDYRNGRDRLRWFYGYMITDHCIRNGNDLMLGFNSAESNKLTDESATAVLAMRQACKNILYTVANSGYYADGNPAAGMSNMTKLS